MAELELTYELNNIDYILPSLIGIRHDYMPNLYTVEANIELWNNLSYCEATSLVTYPVTKGSNLIDPLKHWKAVESQAHPDLMIQHLHSNKLPIS